MLPYRTRLLTCFRAIFGEHTDSELLAAIPDTISNWDSGNHFILVQLVEEEFNVRIPERLGSELLSFVDFERYLEVTLGPAA
ncbi:MAG TPA: hypothetical protein VN442_23275 [Bryobacteraceae bacterium]|nr:hypothetical protein [Bryobacteraceae bacterium]